MNRFWNKIMLPIVKSINAKYIVEIGSDTGINTNNILKYCMENNARMTAIDPYPNFDIDEFKNKYGDKFEIYEDLSLNVLSNLNDYDVILIDGDHNWYTVYNELKIIEENFKDKKFPMVFLHDVGWPYARRDLYYNPKTIPEKYRHTYEKKGMYPGESNLRENGGLNYFLNNAVKENTPKNGVLTAVKDFIHESKYEFSLEIIDAFSGLGILFFKDKSVEKLVKEIIANSNMLEMFERERIDIIIKSSELQDQNNVLRNQLTDNESKVNELRMQLIENKSELNELKTQLNENESELRDLKQDIMHYNQEKELQLKQMNSQINTLTSSICEIKYLNNEDRPLKKRLISNFPSLYVLNKNKIKIKTVFRNIRGYNAIKKNNLVDIGYYLRKNPDVRTSGMDPILHYMYHGANEGRKPNPQFDGNYYLKIHEDVRNSEINPLVHYSLHGIKENRSCLPISDYHAKEFPDNPIDLREFSDNQIDEMMAALSSKISIIIPIYNAFEDTERCINSVLENTKIPYELILIDDCSTDKRIETLLNKMEKIPQIKVIRNLENEGFVKSVNIGMKESEGDVVLLNSDTQVTPRWLQKLAVNAYSAENIGTVTPLSNSAGVFSVPEMSKKNEIPPFLTLNGMASLVERVSENINMEVPTGNGFCMFIKRATINDVGLFDEKSFGRGYGEENDFCMRAIKKSWINIIDDSTYIFHEESSSFSSSKEELSKKNMDILNNKHPSYEEEVKKFVSSPKLKLIQENIKSSIETVNIDSINKKRILYVVHEALHLGNAGGTGYTTNDIIENIQETFECYMLIPTTGELTLWKKGEKIEKIKSWKIESKWSAKDFYNKEFRNIYFNVLTGLKIDIVHIQHLFKHTFDLPKVAKKLGISIILSFHDFYYICPSINLLDINYHCCYGECTSSEGQCLIPSRALEDLPVLKDFVNTWRNEISKIIDICSSFTAPSGFTKDLYSSIYAQLKNKKFKVIEHGRDFKKTNFNLPSLNEPIKILIPGYIDKHKGSEFIKSLKDIDSENRIEFHFIGRITSELKEIGIYHGTYEREEFCRIVNKIKPSFIGIFSVCPETYSHTLSEAWSCGIPVLATKIGALEERINKKGGGWFLDHNNPPIAYDEIIRIINSDEYMSLVNEINNIYLRTKKEMSYDYEYTYWEDLILTDYSKVRSIYKVALFVNGRNGNFPSATYIRLLLAFYHPLLYGKIVPFIMDEDFLSNIHKDSFLTEKNYDCIIVQRDVLDESFSNFLVEKCKEHDIKLIYEIDDDLLDIDPTHSEYEMYSYKRDTIKYLAKSADLVTVSTKNLKSKFENISKVEIIPNALDERLWLIKSDETHFKSLNDNKCIKIGYMGTFTHVKDILMVKKTIKNLKRKFNKDNLKIEFYIIGGLNKPREKWFKQLEIPSENINYPEFVKWLRKSVNWDIAIAPLVNSNINHAKSELKYLEYTGLNLPGVYSEIGAYSISIKNEYNGLLVKNNDLKQWEDQISKLITDKELYNNMKTNAKKDLMKEYLLKYRINIWYDIVKNLVDGKS